MRSQMTKLQRAVLRDCRECDLTLAAIFKKHHVNTLLLDSWMHNSGFRHRLHRVRKAMKHLRETDIAIGSAQAAALLRRTASGPPIHTPWDQRVPAAVNLCVLARGRGLPRKTSAKSKEKPGVKGASLIHPDHTPEEAMRLLDAMDGGERSR